MKNKLSSSSSKEPFIKKAMIRSVIYLLIAEIQSKKVKPNPENVEKASKNYQKRNFIDK